MNYPESPLDLGFGDWGLELDKMLMKGAPLQMSAPHFIIQPCDLLLRQPPPWPKNYSRKNVSIQKIIL